MNLLTDRIVHEARLWVGTKEVGRNDGPEVRAWLARVKRKPGAAWCAAFAWCMLDDACRGLDLTNPLQPVAGVHLLIRMARYLGAWTADPGPGYVFAIDHGRNADGARIGHCGIVVEVSPMHLTTIEGNTNEAGSREGNAVALKTRKISEATLGYLDPGALVLGPRQATPKPTT